MAKRNWKRAQPGNLRDAMDWCIEHAREKHNRSIDHIADLMGLPSKWTLYKWIEAVNLPARMIKPFEHACGIDLVSRYLAVSGGKLVIDMPKGRAQTPEDIALLQEALHAATGVLIRFYLDQISAEAALPAIQTALEQLAWHKLNVEKSRQPELPFDEE